MNDKRDASAGPTIRTNRQDRLMTGTPFGNRAGGWNPTLALLDDQPERDGHRTSSPARRLQPARQRRCRRAASKQEDLRADGLNGNATVTGGLLRARGGSWSPDSMRRIFGAWVRR
jgi:hypothetical protein